MKRFKYIGKTDNGKVRCYTGDMVECGDVVELNAWLSSKAANNPSYKEVKRRRRATVD